MKTHKSVSLVRRAAGFSGETPAGRVTEDALPPQTSATSAIWLLALVAAGAYALHAMTVDDDADDELDAFSLEHDDE